MGGKGKGGDGKGGKWRDMGKGEEKWRGKGLKPEKPRFLPNLQVWASCTHLSPIWTKFGVRLSEETWRTRPRKISP